MNAASAVELELARDIGAFYHDPLGFVLYAFDWSKNRPDAGSNAADAAGTGADADADADAGAGADAGVGAGADASVDTGTGAGAGVDAGVDAGMNAGAGTYASTDVDGGMKTPDAPGPKTSGTKTPGPNTPDTDVSATDLPGSDARSHARIAGTHSMSTYSPGTYSPGTYSPGTHTTKNGLPGTASGTTSGTALATTAGAASGTALAATAATTSGTSLATMSGSISGSMAPQAGPDEWQREVLRSIGAGTRTASGAVREAISSGHGVGKSALVAWIILWAMSTRPHLAGVVTANTAGQLNGKTWRELALWHKRAVNRHWFKWTATRFCQVNHPETWFVSAIPWSKDRPEAFAGLHAEHVLMIFDEASAVENAIWETAEGAMTTPGAIWCVFGNPTRNSGAFFECFNRMKHRWTHRKVDSRTAKMANNGQIDQWIEDYGEDSDFVRVRVRGEFPRAGGCQLISSEAVATARGRHLAPDMYAAAPRILGVDVARFGDDQSVIATRQGLAAFELAKFRGLDTMTLAGIVAQRIEAERPAAVFIDEGGMGAGVVDRLRQLGHSVMGVNFGAAAANSSIHLNKRTEMWCALRDWLGAGAAIPDDAELAADLTAPEYGFTGDKGQLFLEKKRDMKKRGLASPDCGDALALTFAHPVQVNRAGRSGRVVQKSSIY